MTELDWKKIVEGVPLFDATIVLDNGQETVETTTGSSLQEAETRLQPGWQVPIRVIKLVPHKRTP